MDAPATASTPFRLLIDLVTGGRGIAGGEDRDAYVLATDPGTTYTVGARTDTILSAGLEVFDANWNLVSGGRVTSNGTVLEFRAQGGPYYVVVTAPPSNNYTLSVANQNQSQAGEREVFDILGRVYSGALNFASDGDEVRYNFISGHTYDVRIDSGIADLLVGTGLNLSIGLAANVTHTLTSAQIAGNRLFVSSASGTSLGAYTVTIVDVTAGGPTSVFPIGTAGNDRLAGSNSSETIFALGGDDTVAGLGGNDTIDGGEGTNYLRGDDGNDALTGGAGFDDINGNMGNDTCVSGGGDDWVVGGKDNDSLVGSAGQNLVYGNLGDDTCDGGEGADTVRGGQGGDVIAGGDGADYMSGDRDNDTVSGGAGADIFHTFGEAAIDRVTDFTAAEGDRVQVDPGTQFTLSQVGADTVINMTGGGQVILVGVELSTLPQGWIFGA